MKEAEILYPHNLPACLISIGAGLAATIDIRKSLPWFKRKIFKVLPLDAIRAVQAIATDCEADADDVYHQLQAAYVNEVENYYVRLNVDRGMQNIRLDKWEKLGDVQAFTKDYLGGPEVKQRANRAVKGMADRSMPQYVSELGKSSFLRTQSYYNVERLRTV